MFDLIYISSCYNQILQTHQLHIIIEIRVTKDYFLVQKNWQVSGNADWLVGGFCMVRIYDKYFANKTRHYFAIKAN